ncbi:MAG: UvrD-helicase domain-containing protein [Syntrophaceae bacterium]|nr:UvrD-helicase domain-containing protein [Syntrophaceae bacterium]
MTDSTAQTSELSDVMDICLNLEDPKSFFLFAGAGSGKTRALVEAMQMFRLKYGQEFRLSARKVAVITYTNAACDEIKHRIDYDSIFAVSTIHSFAWELIRSYHNDIREWLSHSLEMEINALKEKQQKGRAGKASADRAVQIESKQKRIARLDTIRHFTYNPNGENIGKNSLNHAEVIGIASDFLTDKPLMQRILIRKYPVLLIDESQDTQKDLVNAFFAVQSAYSGEFCLALFGDTMQRIYSDGKIGLGEAVPSDWEKPAITINYRCPKRIVKLINKIRSGADDHIQEPADDAPEGFVRLFLVQDDDGISKTTVEAEIAKKMAEITSDNQWSGDNQEIKTLTLEHHMAARRGGFNDFFEPLYQISKFKTGLLDGTLSGIPFFSQQILPLVKSLQAKNWFAVARIVKKYSPLVSADTLKTSESSLDEICKADHAVKSLFSLWDGDSDPSLIDSLKVVAASGLFAVPDVFLPIESRANLAEDESESNDSAETTDNNPNIDAWDNALSVPFSQLESYVQYISDKSPFGTHQGIKGLQFPRVMVVLDDNEARGFMFSYDKLFGAKAPTSTDIKNEEEGKETSTDRTRRLFYVTCSRAQSSLAVVVYTRERDKIIGHLQNLKWFDDCEIIEMD